MQPLSLNAGDHPVNGIFKHLRWIAAAVLLGGYSARIMGVEGRMQHTDARTLFSAKYDRTSNIKVSLHAFSKRGGGHDGAMLWLKVAAAAVSTLVPSAAAASGAFVALALALVVLTLRRPPYYAAATNVGRLAMVVGFLVATLIGWVPRRPRHFCLL